MSVNPGSRTASRSWSPAPASPAIAARYPSAASASRKTTGFPAARACATAARCVGASFVQPPQQDAAVRHISLPTCGGPSRVPPGQVLERLGENRQPPRCRLSTSARTAVSRPRSDGGDMRRPFLAQPPHLLELARRVKPLQPGDAAPPRLQAVRVGGELGRGLGERRGAGGRAARAGVRAACSTRWASASSGSSAPRARCQAASSGSASAAPMARCSRRRPGPVSMPSAASRSSGWLNRSTGSGGTASSTPASSASSTCSPAAAADHARSSARVGVSATAAAWTTASTSAG